MSAVGMHQPCIALHRIAWIATRKSRQTSRNAARYRVLLDNKAGRERATGTEFVLDLEFT